MAQLRQNPVTGRWIAVAPTRSARPRDEAGSKEVADSAGAPPSHDPTCPFCPGNEAELPDVLWELGDGGEHGWRCRAVPNRYPAFAPEGPAPGAPATGEDVGRELSEDGPVRFGDARPARGVQEVLIESARHDRSPVRMPDDELLAAARLYRARLEELTRGEPGFEPVVFHNEGRDAGASLTHPHAQLVATASTGPARRIRQRRMERYRRETGECLICGLTDREPDGEARLVEEDAFHRVYVPWAPEQPYETWILPRSHRASFADVDDEELASWSGMLSRALRRTRSLLGKHAYQYIVHTASGERRDDPALHWFLRLRPITGRRAGFEVATGIGINPASPEEVAERLRATEPTRNKGGET